LFGENVADWEKRLAHYFAALCVETIRIGGTLAENRMK
jgi:hypothetical protein